MAGQFYDLSPGGKLYPDDNSTKHVFLQADGKTSSGDRHVTLFWINGYDRTASVNLRRVVHLTGGVGNYHFLSPSVKIQGESSVSNHTLYQPGKFTRAQRDQILAFAHAIQFERKSVVNNCQTWMRDLFVAMLSAGLITQQLFDHIDAAVQIVMTMWRAGMCEIHSLQHTVLLRSEV
ncbi:hypothetical protein BXZ70DRAFT_910509 [Cristinia sonorae]|uniref:Uncharacterized protein n=1 Tax=Cristinia sonorae TaxID=1940300 RepID=A0A8K0UHB8_9AGAR|nr:hypothetical protein BXZ70DRAFT_910509 [Cristinia sonorae]